MPMNRPPSKKSPAYDQEARVPAMLRVRGDRIVGIEDHKGNVLGMPLTFSENSSGGVAYPWYPGGGTVAFDDLMPTHSPILNPDRHIGMAPVVSGAATLDVDTTPEAGEFYTSSLRITTTGAFNGSFTFALPDPSQLGYTTQKTRAGAMIGVRIKCSDWSAVTKLFARFIQPGQTAANCNIGTIVDAAGKTTYGQRNAAYSSRWNGKWRTIFIPSALFSVLGSPPAPWRRDARYMDVGSIFFDVVATAAVEIKINRIFSIDWPVGFCAWHLDGFYPAALAATKEAFGSRGWGFSGGVSSLNYSAAFPTTSDIQALAASGAADIYSHVGDIDVSNAATTFGAASTPARVLSRGGEMRASIAAMGVRGRGMAHITWLGNAGRSAGDNAALARAMGATAGGRASCIDGEWGIDPWSADLNVVSNTMFRSHWVADRGRYNRAHCGLHYPALGVAPTAAELDNWNSANCQARLELDYAALGAGGIFMWGHELSATLTDGGPNFGPNMFASFVAALEGYVKAGKLLVLKKSEVHALTYGRRGVRMRWDGEWVDQSDPATIVM